MKKVISPIVALALASSLSFAGKNTVKADDVVIDIPTVEKVYDDSFYTLGLKVGTLGVGIDASYPLTHNFSIRGNVNGFYYKRNLNDIINDPTFNSFGGNADGELTLLTVGLLVDYFPFDESDFRLSGGVYYNGNELKITGDAANATQTFTYNGTTYTGADLGTVTGNSVFDKVAPYIGIGWGNRGDEEGWSWSLDIGALYQNVPQIEAKAELTTNAVNLAAATIKGYSQASIDADVNAEVTKENNDIKNSDFAKYTKFYPVIAIGITYSF